MNYDNHAARLLFLLEKGKEKAPTTPCREVWEELLEVDSSDASLLMARLSKVMELPRLNIASLKDEFPEQQDSWSYWESQVNSAFMAQNVHAKWETFINHIDNHTLTYLRMASALLQSKANTKLIADADLLSIRHTLDTILLEVLSSDFPADVKKYVVRNIRKIIDSIDEYKLTGALPLIDAVEAALGHLAVDRQYKSILTDTELGKRFLDTLASMANVVTVAVGLPQLTQAIALLSN